ncbi:MAG: lipoyl(octanoyl) transferase LipB [Holosporaceae bacterium]
MQQHAEAHLPLPSFVNQMKGGRGTLKQNKGFVWCVSHTPFAYDTALSLMEDYRDAFDEKKVPPLVWLLTHTPVYTSGTSGGVDDLLEKNLDVPLVKTGRGGRVTYHGPGQRMVYVVLPLAFFDNSLKGAVSFLGQWCVKALAVLGVKAFFDAEQIGVWTSIKGKARKIASLGLRVRKKVIYHGFCLNVAPDLRYFKQIRPCGLSGACVTSLKDLGFDTQQASVDEALELVFFEKINETVRR